MRTIMMGLVLAATLNGCATVGGVGVNTSNHGIWYQDCGVSRQIPGATATFKGTLTSPNSAVATDDQQPPKSSNVKGIIRVIIPHPDTCNGRGVDLGDLDRGCEYAVEDMPGSHRGARLRSGNLHKGLRLTLS